MAVPPPRAANTVKEETDSLCTNMILWKSWIVKSVSEIVCYKPSLLSCRAQEICSNRLFFMTQGQKSANSREVTQPIFFTLRNSSLSPPLPSPSGKTPSCLSPGIEQPLHCGGKKMIKLIVEKLRGEVYGENAFDQPTLFPRNLL